jgi:hypothetical protein
MRGEIAKITNDFVNELIAELVGSFEDKYGELRKMQDEFESKILSALGQGECECNCGENKGNGTICTNCGKPLPQPNFKCSCGATEISDIKGDDGKGNIILFCNKCGKPEKEPRKECEHEWRFSLGPLTGDNDGYYCCKCGVIKQDLKKETPKRR